jgi:protein-disulfide isomerase
MTFGNRPLAAALLALTLALPAAQPVRAQSFSPDQKGAIENIIREYLLSHPELLQEAMAELEKRQAVAEAEKHREGVKEHAELIFSSPRGITLGNPQGDVTVVEFFDYNCPFCRKAAGDLDALLETDGELRLGLVNNPILSPASKEAAAVEYAVLSQRPEAAYDFYKALFRGRGIIGRERALGVAADLGLDRAAVAQAADAGGTAEALERQLKLAASMGFSATPSFVISGTGILGYPGPKSLAAIIASVRRCDTVAC